MQNDPILNNLSEIKSLLTNQNGKQVLSVKEACQFLGFSKSHLYKLTHKQRIPHYKPSGKLLFFERNELQEWLLHNRITPQDEIEAQSVDYITRNKRLQR